MLLCRQPDPAPSREPAGRAAEGGVPLRRRAPPALHLPDPPCACLWRWRGGAALPHPGMEATVPADLALIRPRIRETCRDSERFNGGPAPHLPRRRLLSFSLPLLAHKALFFFLSFLDVFSST